MHIYNKNKSASKRTLTRMVKNYVASKATKQEEEFLEAYYMHFEDDKDILDDLSPAERDRLEQEMENAIFSRLSIRKSRSRYLQIAASLLVGISLVTAIFVTLSKKKPVEYAARKSTYHNDIAPGGNKAILTLANGQQVSLDDIKIGKQVKQGNSVVNKLSDGRLIYRQLALFNDPSAVSFNTIQTPTGGQYQVVLPDGSKVWLNSKSSLRFPTAFQGNERVVVLTGEGYFEVAKKTDMPFKVKVNDMEIKVLGTHFNIMAYTNEPFVKTTLLEGSVNISQGAAVKTLKPGQQAKVGTGGTIEVITANTDEAVAWKNGYFNFNQNDIQTVMRQLSRWYDMEVVYEGAIPDDEFSGKMRRNIKASKALQILELTNMHFKIDGKKVTVISN